MVNKIRRCQVDRAEAWGMRAYPVTPRLAKLPIFPKEVVLA